MNCKDKEKYAGYSRRKFFGKIGLATVAGAVATTVGPALLRSGKAEAKSHKNKQIFFPTKS